MANTALSRLQSLLAKLNGGKQTTLLNPVEAYLHAEFTKALHQKPAWSNEQTVGFLSTVTSLLHNTQDNIRHQALDWLIQNVLQHPQLPHTQRAVLLNSLKPYWSEFQTAKLLLLAEQPDMQEATLNFLCPFHWTTMQAQIPVILYVLRLWEKQEVLPQSQKWLKQLDAPFEGVTHWILQHFPASNVEHNHRLILLLGELGKNRCVRPLISFASEYPEFNKSLCKAFHRLHHDNVNQFYVDQITHLDAKEPMLLLDVVKQIRERKLRKAIPRLEDLFPLDDGSGSFVLRAINGEIALTLGQFGCTQWAREKLMPDLVLNGMQNKYLKAIELLGLEDAIPLLKALLLVPETPELEPLQNDAHRVCQQLLLQQKQRLQSLENLSEMV